MNKQQNAKSSNLSFFLVVLSILAVVIGMVGAIVIYQNNKTDGFNNGQITVASCSEKDWSWRIYTCTGSYFSTGGGMVERDNVNVTAFGQEYKDGDIIDDVYAPAFSDNGTTDHFVTGRERASVTYNIPWLMAILLAFLLPIVTAFTVALGKRK